MTANQSSHRRFVLTRTEDVSGTSGIGIVAEGIEWSNGTVHVHWISQLESYEQAANIRVLLAIHGHAGRTEVTWVD